MSETYQSKRERRQRMLDTLPVGLREHVSLRNVETVAMLSPQAQMRLLEAIQSGLKRISRAAEQLRMDPEISLADLLDPPFPSEVETIPWQTPANIQPKIADLIQQCYPDMPRIAAEALAESQVMGIVRGVAGRHQQMLQSNHVKTDFIMLTLYGLMRQTLERLEEIIDETPALRQAFEKTYERRKEETC
jgi:hypothetical protein